MIRNSALLVVLSASIFGCSENDRHISEPDLRDIREMISAAYYERADREGLVGVTVSKSSRVTAHARVVFFTKNQKRITHTCVVQRAALPNKFNWLCSE